MKLKESGKEEMIKKTGKGNCYGHQVGLQLSSAMV